MEYIPNYPIASHRIDEELQGNRSFKAFVEVRGFESFFIARNFAYGIIELDPTSRCASTGSQELHLPSYTPTVAVRAFAEADFG